MNMRTTSRLVVLGWVLKKVWMEAGRSGEGGHVPVGSTKMGTETSQDRGGSQSVRECVCVNEQQQDCAARVYILSRSNGGLFKDSEYRLTCSELS